jgi:hypothetical protein
VDPIADLLPVDHPVQPPHATSASSEGLVGALNRA